jgi:hypothetical protein
MRPKNSQLALSHVEDDKSFSKTQNSSRKSCLAVIFILKKETNVERYWGKIEDERNSEFYMRSLHNLSVHMRVFEYALCSNSEAQQRTSDVWLWALTANLDPTCTDCQRFWREGQDTHSERGSDLWHMLPPEEVSRDVGRQSDIQHYEEKIWFHKRNAVRIEERRKWAKRGIYTTHAEKARSHNDYESCFREKRHPTEHCGFPVSHYINICVEHFVLYPDRAGLQGHSMPFLDLNFIDFIRLKSWTLSSSVALLAAFEKQRDKHMAGDCTLLEKEEHTQSFSGSVKILVPAHRHKISCFW